MVLSEDDSIGRQSDPIDAEVVATLLAGKKVKRPMSLTTQTLKQLGLEWDDEDIWLRSGVEPLQVDRIRDRLSSNAALRWSNFRVAMRSGSTNAELMALGWSARGCALTTEYQAAGRGRRGRSWISPIGRNIAVSLCISKAGDLSGMAGLSLVVGLAVADALRSLGLQAVALKWPNDLIVMHSSGGYSKLGGILVELQHRLKSPDMQPGVGETLAIIGIGLNIGGASSIENAVDQPLADISLMQPVLRREEVLLAVVNALADYVTHWEEFGFMPMCDVYDELHAFTGERVLVSDADSVRSGTVEGVAPGGQLRLRGVDDVVFEIDAGEVSLRPRSAGTAHE